MPIFDKIEANKVEVKATDEFEFLIKNRDKMITEEPIQIVESYETTPEEIQEAQYDITQNRIEYLEDLIASIYDMYDKQHRQAFLKSLSNLIIDSSTAVAAKDAYNKVWFQTQLFSIKAKQEIAALLTQLCESHQKGSAALFWQRVVDEEPGALDSVAFKPQED